MTVYREIRCSSACNKLKRRLPYGWDLNIHRGCEHGCRYCFAIYTHKYTDSKDYFGEILVKTNIVEKLEEQLSAPSWKREVVNIGGVTDSYQPAEARYKLMPEILKLLIKYETPCIISTKSDLIVRDFDLIDRLSRVAHVNIASTITAMDETVRRKLEPGGAPSLRRFAALKEFSNTQATTGLHIMPIVPYLTDTDENFEGLYSNAQESRVTYVLPGTLYLRGVTRSLFFDFIRKDYPVLYDPLFHLYRSGGAGKEYKGQMYMRENRIRKKYGLTSDYRKFMKDDLFSKSGSEGGKGKRGTEPVQEQLSFLDWK